jgi:hypothetical protein
MSNNVKLENPLYGVSLTLAERVIIDSKNNENDANYIHIQSSASNTWVINHNLGKYGSVTVVDDNSDVVIGEIRYNTVNQVTLTFTSAFTGRAFFN